MPLNSFYYVLLSSQRSLWTCTFFVLLGGIFYFILLRYFAAPLLYFQTMVLPIVVFYFGIRLTVFAGTGKLRDLLGGADAPDNWLYFIGILLIAASVMIGYRFWRMRHASQQTLQVLQVPFSL